MKKILLLGFIFVFSFSVLGQGLKLKKGLPTAKRITEQKVAIEPQKTVGISTVVTPTPSTPKAPGIINVITLGTSANAYGYGYSGGQKTMVWTDDDLGIITNLHLMGPGTTPPALSGYLAVDKAINQGQSTGDWTNNYQVCSALLNTSGTYYADASRYPQSVIYNPPGNTDLNNVYIHFFCPNLSNGGSWGGYNYGVCNWTDQTDSTKHMKWYDFPPSQYIPDGMTITKNGVALVADLDRNWESGSGAYLDQFIINRGVWNDTEKDFDYEQFVVPLAMDTYPVDNRIAASPDGQIIWMVTLGNNGGAEQIGDRANYYPILQVSNDAGVTWSDPIAVQLDGPNGIDGIKNGLSDYRLKQLYGTVPDRDEIPYTTAFDVDLVVDKLGNPHIGVVIGIASDEEDYTIITGDSNCIVYDIFSWDDGTVWCAQKMGTLKTFQGTFGDLTEDNRVNTAINKTGDHIFLTWLDTHVEGVTDNNRPDIFARGFNILNCSITSNDGEDNSDNVTFLSDINHQAYFQCTSHNVFTKAGGGHILPIVTELLSDPTNADEPVTFKYISDFSYLPEDYTILIDCLPIWWIPPGIDESKTDHPMSGEIFPNPLSGTGTLTISLNQSGNLVIEITNIVGQKVMSLDKGFVNSGAQQFTIDVSRLQAGVYFYTIKLNDQKYTNNMVVK